MSQQNQQAFIRVFKAAFEKCFGFSLEKPLSETESKQFSNAILEATGLVIGAKSLKNYSAYLYGGTDAKSENPSAATLDTLARYVLNAPFSDELQRKEKEGHYPYWFTYKSSLASPTPAARGSKGAPKKQPAWLYVALIITALTLGAVGFMQWPRPTTKLFVDRFKSLTEDSLSKHGWLIQAKDHQYWPKRAEGVPGITLYTLRGDNWPDTANAMSIKNLMLRKLESECFSVELHLDNFIPVANWQQAGLLLMEDTTFTGRSLRFSIGYNDYFGGYRRPGEIIIQGVHSAGEEPGKPEEIAHIPLFTMEQNNDSLVKKNLRFSALRIEKDKNGFRLLYSASPVENFALKEAFTKNISIEPRYVGVFALQGFVNNTSYVPAHISFFSLSNDECRK